MTNSWHSIGPASAQPPTFHALRNAECVYGNTRIRLKDGIFREPAPPGWPEAYYAEYSIQTAVLGDLDGNHLEDAAVVLIYNPSGTYASWAVAAMLNVGGTPTFASAASWGDRDRVNDVFIRME